MVISTPAITPHDAESYIQRRLSLRHLRVVLALVEGGSLSAAADALHVTQPAISKALGEIERGLGQTLFVRRGRNIVVTPLGSHIVRLARKLDADLRRGAESVASLVRGTSGEVLIGATNAAMAQIVPDALAAMKGQFPNVTLSVRSHALSSLFDELRGGQIDVVVARAPAAGQPDDVQAVPLLSMPEVVAMSAHHPLAKERRLSWETLNEQAWIWQLPGTHTRMLQDRLWARMGLPLPTNLIETGDTTLALSMMQRMPLLSIMPRPVADIAAKQGMLVMLPLKVDLGLSSLMLWHLREPQTELVEHFKRLLQEAAGGAPAAQD